MVCVSFYLICIVELFVSSVICRFQGLSYLHVPDCVRVFFYYLPKFSIFASMFVWWFVCLSVCLSVRNFFETGHSFLYIFTKLDSSMHLCRLTKPIVFLGQKSNNWVTRSKVGQIGQSAITPPVFKLERRSNAQNVGNWTGYLDDIPNFRWHLWRKRTHGPQIFVGFENFQNFVIFNIASIW